MSHSGPGFLELAVRTAVRAGERTLAAFGRLDPASIGFKGIRDLVTRADLESERLITSTLREAFPEHLVLAEEELSGGGGQVDGMGAGMGGMEELAAAAARSRYTRYTWIIDPLDGTTNFAHSHPFYAVSVALYERGEPLLGVVFAPVLGELFVAERGSGCRLNDRRIEVCRTDALDQAIFATGFPYRRNELSALENNVEHFNRFIHDVRGFRRGGSAALDLAYVAAGRFGFFFEAQLSPWDVAAGALLVREAGGRVSDYEGGENWLFGRRILASNGRLHELARARLKERPG
jgi:myo-inositol-1(or 4)-monophosphatase